MSQTYINLLLHDLIERWNEITILLSAAEENKTTNIDLHDAICRSATVLIVANLEGFYKDLIKDTIYDLNDYYDFVQLPSAIKRGFCLNFLDKDSSDNKKNEIITKLITEFERLDVNLDHKPFLFDRNNNPKPDVIEKLFKGLGVRKVFKKLQVSRYEQVFQEENSYLEEKIPKYIDELKSLTNTFPYKCVTPCFNAEQNNIGGRTLWEEFLDGLNRRRHDIAHGSEYSNVDSVSSLILVKNKVILLQVAFIHIIIEEFKEV